MFLYLSIGLILAYILDNFVSDLYMNNIVLLILFFSVLVLWPLIITFFLIVLIGVMVTSVIVMFKR